MARRSTPDPFRRRRRGVPILHLLPNMMTLGAICAGLTAIRLSVDGRFAEAVALIVLAAILDGLDGRMARMIGSESAIGAELDSLADFLNFGVATGLLAYMAGLQDLERLGWIAVLIYVICCVMRLARFNVDAKNPAPGASLGGFIGVPSPAGAMLALMPVFLNRAFPELPDLPDVLAALWLIFAALLMVSRIPTPSLKLLRFRSDQLRYILIATVALIGLLFTWPWHMLLFGGLAYLALVAWSLRPGKAGHGSAPEPETEPEAASETETETETGRGRDDHAPPARGSQD